MNKIKIIGLIQANNEWPLLAISVSHALTYHVDEVCLLEHLSDNNSYSQAKNLQNIWGNRLHIYNYSDNNFFQEASISALIEISQEFLPDWIWAFDADEFLLTSKFKSLKNILNNLGPKYSIVRYEIQNWVSTEGFDAHCLDNYLQLRYRSITNELLTYLPSNILADEIFHENLNFYDVPFPSKVIFKNDPAIWLSAGAHTIKKSANGEIKTDQFWTAHFPFLAKKRLFLKAKQGERLAQSGFSTSHGWQSHLICSLLKKNKLDHFWKNHSVSSHVPTKATMQPSYIEDDTFVETIVPIISFLKNKIDFESAPNINTFEDSKVPLRALVNLAHKYQTIAGSMQEERDEKLVQINLLHKELNQLQEDLALLSEKHRTLKIKVAGWQNTYLWVCLRSIKNKIKKFSYFINKSKSSLQKFLF